MLNLNLKRVFALRGIDNPAAFMINAGIVRATANNLLGQQTSVVKIEHLGLLCRLLNCTPNDFFEWQTESKNALPESHSLNNLKRSQSVQAIRSMVKDIPLEKMEELIGGQNS
jgi:DNA-binding Xre family transcriptional regulator